MYRRHKEDFSQIQNGQSSLLFREIDSPPVFWVQYPMFPAKPGMGIFKQDEPYLLINGIYIITGFKINYKGITKSYFDSDLTANSFFGFFI